MATSPPSTLSDYAWSLLFLGLLLILMVGGMFVGAAYFTPAVLGPNNGQPRHGFAKLVEAVGLFGGMAIGLGIALLVICVVARRFVSVATHQRWAVQLENGAPEINPIAVRMARLLTKFMAPR